MRWLDSSLAMFRPAYSLVCHPGSGHFAAAKQLGPVKTSALRPLHSPGSRPTVAAHLSTKSHSHRLANNQTRKDQGTIRFLPFSDTFAAPVIGQSNLRRYNRLAKHNIAIRPIGLASVGAVVELLLTEFRLEEPLFSLLKLKSKECHPFFVDVVRSAVPDRCSYIAVDTSSGVVCAARINSVIKEAPQLISEKTIANLRQSAKLKYVLQVINQCEAQLFKHIPQDSRVLKFDVVSVANAYQNQRIATTLITLSMEKAREVDSLTGESRFTHIAVVATSAKAQALYRDKLGFKSVYELRLKNFVGFDNDRPFTKIQDNPVVQLMVKDLADHSAPDPIEIQENKAHPPVEVQLHD